jgi:hypothetical protein
MMQLHLVVMEERPHEAARRHPEPLSWKATKLTTYPSEGAGSWWSNGGTLHSGWFWLAFGRRRPSWTNSSSFLSITEERAHASAGRIWLFPAMVIENSVWRRQRKK